MKTASMILSSLTILMALSQLICGLWIGANGADTGNLAFHSRLGIGTVVMTVITLIVLLVTLYKR